jgi:hypothetical protein
VSCSYGGGPETPKHFFAVASGLMRQILVEYARTRKAAKRNGGWRLTLDEAVALPRRPDLDLVSLDECAHRTQPSGRAAGPDCGTAIFRRLNH